MTPLIYLLIVILHAWYDAKQIKKGVSIDHKIESIVSGLVCAVIGCAILAVEGVNKNTSLVVQTLPLILLPLLTRAAVFDPALNLMRGLPWLYEGVKKPRSKESTIDRIERWIGLPVALYRIIYGVVYILYLIVYYA